ncbi:MAG: 6,7-dimethyl-8-ribityllumazine synthase, partial [Candidatus Omnitrophica bacterium]|nr:6,7-dimethyl-8-ribityllumazine synthase [Candidatus Omnitrophota bacterium]
MATHIGRLCGRGKRFAIVVSRFNQFITQRLLDSAVETLQKTGVTKTNIHIVWVPGALEIPFFCRQVGATRKWDALIVLA